MLSILIPVYESDVNELVETLHRQCLTTGVNFEIVCFDDGSGDSIRQINRAVSALDRVRYEELPQNIGRSAIRNALANAARYDYLLFMDNDSRVVREDFIRRYLDHLAPDQLLCGGRCYSPTPPQEPDLYLHWLYGTNREQIPAAIRRQHPWHGFMTNNFVVPKALFQSIRFEESILEYGHEDTLFGRELGLRRIPVIHIDNPLEHIGLESNNTFLKKAAVAVRNLHRLSCEYPDLDTRLLRVFKAVKRLRLAGFLLYVLHDFQGILLASLRSRRPLLYALDAYKLGLLLWEDKLVNRQ
ncbi:MAG: glycosyltransferase family 2 protein [Saprospiraceae bacterium]|nr:glycosyltransferase family 2 protein [Saprospiraceae bacterium]